MTLFTFNVNPEAAREAHRRLVPSHLGRGRIKESAAHASPGKMMTEDGLPFVEGQLCNSRARVRNGHSHE